MNRLIKQLPKILLLCIAGILIFQLCASKEQKMDLLFKQFNNIDNGPGASVMVIKNGEIIFKKSYGLADMKRKIPANEYTNYRIASMTKAFTAMSIMILKEKKLLKYDTKLTDVFSDFPDYGKKITIKNLLEHQSGLIDYQKIISKDQKEQVKDEDVLKLYKVQNRLECEPGSKFQYRDADYVLLAMVVQKVSRMRFADFLEENIFNPLEMNNTVAYEKGISTVKNRAYGTTKINGKYMERDQSLVSAVLGDGGIYTSLMDYYKWDQALYTDKLVSLETLNEAFSSGSPTGEGDVCGYGWFHYLSYGRKVIGFAGGTCGFGSAVARIPSEKLTVVVLTNYNAPNSFINTYSKYMKPIVKMYSKPI
ncbi:serine hydrolase domain-containing protein [Crassaminicella profunda]|uniref:serine hydrolase domain-containing protein n=1 Tax=Crassaminicella profunda TaxID=1286698 RepID=UPI001CA6794A|nr:serine hydrolase [Crassaminicella profunda]QZY53822.1 beta-lactamase family protein [Crassaminicella profunda]